MQFNPKPTDPLEDLREKLIAAQTDKLLRGDKRRIGTRDLGDRVETFDLETGETISSKEKGAPPEKPMSDAALRSAYERALVDKEKLKRNPLTEALAGGQTEGYEAADVQFKALEAEMKRRGLLPGGPKQSTQAAPATPATPGQKLDAKTAAAILEEAGGDKNKAREIARQRGYKF